MKISGLCLLVCAEVAFAATLGSKPEVEKRQLAGILGALASGDTSILGALGNGKYGRQTGAKPAGEAPLKEEQKSSFTVPGVKRIKIRTGPYLVPGMNRQNSYSKHWGMLESYYDTKIEKPCSECNILRQQGGLEYANGTNANIDTGLWLHHMVHFNVGDRRWDPSGISEASCIPHEGINTMGGSALGKGQISTRNAERYFVTGNERTPFNYYKAGTSPIGSAYHLDAADKFFYLVELMNMNMNDASVYITMTYDIIDGALPAGWSEVKTVYLDANACKSSEVPSPKGKTQFQIQSKPWKPNVEGVIIDSMGHLHDGGIEIETMATSTNPLCKANAVYSSKPEYVYRDMGMPMHGDVVAKDHISDMPGCGPTNVAVPKMSRDQSWITRGTYDYNKRTANLEAGSPSEVMAIAIVLVQVPPGPLKPVKA
ncbi:hypothetical protein EJ08DRAFT_702936 [Tothia fuscella]|uniref:Uncharacterized protein n=1 Tax=Tothia fuscella TaxID=1048955 RepID=A0A9P4TTA6_9PEZI|nr:hypothetical protein EJ08DRAFT_702936 [Tothia fuscella]